MVTSHRFSGGSETDPSTGWQILSLRYRDPRDRAKDLEARIAPEAGGNLFWLTLGSDQILVQPETLADLKKHRSGAPIMHPFPNRVRDATFEFGGHRCVFEPNNGPNFLHGLVRQRPWKSGRPAISSSAAQVAIWIDWSAAQPDFPRFPFPHRLTVTYKLTCTSIRIAYAVENRGRSRLPFGLGLHPFFRVPQDRRDVFLRVPAARRMEAVERLPTGKLIPVRGTRYDVRRWTQLEGLDLDDVYLGITPASKPGFELRDRGVRVTLTASRDFGHFVVYTPPGQPFFCMENQTCSTDAHNMHQRNPGSATRLMILRGGGTKRGHMAWRLERIAAR